MQKTKVKERIRRGRAGEFLALWDEAVLLQQAPTRGRRKKSPVEEVHLEVRNAKRSLRLIREGQYTRAGQALTSAGLAQQTRATMNAMKDLHPQGPPLLPSDTEPSSPPLRFSQERVLKGIKTFKAGSAPGPDGLRAEHLKVAVKLSPPNRTDKALEAITRLVNVLAAGGLPEAAAPYFCGARLYAGNKKSGGIRPIAVGYILRRLTSKCFSYVLADKAARLLAPLQVGVGVPGGCDAVVHTVRAIVEDPNIPADTRSVLQVDLINAFHSVDRATAYKEIRELFPEVAKWLKSTYGTQPELIFGDLIISSCQGFHQGDPLACLFFAVVLHLIMKKIAMEVPELFLNSWFLDDGNLVGTLEDLIRAIKIIIQEGPARGLILSTRSSVPRHKDPKSTIWNPDYTFTSPDPLGLGVRLVTEPGIVLLGSPIGSPRPHR